MSLAAALIACTGSYVFFRFTQMLVIGRRLKADVYMACSDKSIWRVLVPSWIDIPWIVNGNMHPYRVKHSEFAKIGREAYIQVSMEQSHIPTVFIADPQAIKEITRPRAPFIADTSSSGLFFLTYGPNIITVEEEAWKRHRKIIQKAFSEQNVQLVWSESVHVTEKLFEKWDQQREQDIQVPHVTRVVETLALMVISSAALGQRMSWNQDLNKTLPSGYVISFQEALTVVSRSIIARVLTPTWAENWTQSTRKMATGFSELKRYLQDMAASYKKQGKLDQGLTGTETITLTPAENLFGVIITASDEDKAEDGKGLTVEEATGNAFLFLVAGHETTAHALAFSFGLLAAHPEVQQEVYAQAKNVLGQRKTFEYNDLSSLKLVTGTFLEALRIYPVAPRIPKLAAEDFILSVARNDSKTGENERENIFIPAKSRIVISILAAHYNPLYWPEPEQFRPARFTEAYNKDAFLAFSVGRRACIGRRFAETEATAVLATVLAQYEVSIDYTNFPAISGESPLARRERLLRPNYMITLAPEKLPLVFKRR